jgi:hypothetical protein
MGVGVGDDVAAGVGVGDAVGDCREAEGVTCVGMGDLVGVGDAGCAGGTQLANNRVVITTKAPTVPAKNGHPLTFLPSSPRMRTALCLTPAPAPPPVSIRRRGPPGGRPVSAVPHSLARRFFTG